MCQQEIIYSHTLQAPDVDNDKNKEEVEDVVENEQKQFNSILLGEESRDTTTTSGRFQQEFIKAMNKHLSDEDRKHMLNFQDDFVVFSNDLPTLFRTFEGFLTMCRESRVTINPVKSYVTVGHVKFCGFILNEQGVQPSEKKVDSITKMIVPKNRSEVRSVMGMFNQFRHFFVRYDRIVLHIHKLLKKKQPFIWGEEVEKGFNCIRNRLLAMIKRFRRVNQFRVSYYRMCGDVTRHHHENCSP